MELILLTIDLVLSDSLMTHDSTVLTPWSVAYGAVGPECHSLSKIISRWTLKGVFLVAGLLAVESLLCVLMCSKCEMISTNLYKNLFFVCIGITD